MCCAKLHCFLLVSSVYTVESHDLLLFWWTLIGQCRSYDLIQLPLQFSTQMSSSGGINCIKSRLFFDIIVLFLFLGSGCPNFCKNGSARGVHYQELGVLRGVLFMGSSPETRIILVKNAGCLLFILYGSSWICYLNPVCSGHLGLKCLACESRVTP